MGVPLCLSTPWAWGAEQHGGMDPAQHRAGCSGSTGHRTALGSAPGPYEDVCLGCCRGHCTGHCIGRCTGHCMGHCTGHCMGFCMGFCTGHCTGLCMGCCMGCCMGHGMGYPEPRLGGGVAAASDLVPTSSAGSDPSAGQHCSLLAAGTRAGGCQSGSVPAPGRALLGLLLLPPRTAALRSPRGSPLVSRGRCHSPRGSRLKSVSCVLRASLGVPCSSKAYGGPGVAGQSLCSFSVPAAGRVVWGLMMGPGVKEQHCCSVQSRHPHSTSQAPGDRTSPQTGCMQCQAEGHLTAPPSHTQHPAGSLPS